VHPAGNRTGDLSLMRRGWYHKTIASALTCLLLVVQLSGIFWIFLIEQIANFIGYH
jgi:hypothetical protein